MNQSEAKTQDFDFTLPTIISTTTILNSFVRGAHKAVKILGSEYFAVVSKNITRDFLDIYRSSSDFENVTDPLSPIETNHEADKSIWSLKLESYELSKGSASGYTHIFADTPVQFMFNTEVEAINYIDSLEAKVVELITNAAETANKTTNQEADSDG